VSRLVSDLSSFMERQKLPASELPAVAELVLATFKGLPATEFAERERCCGTAVKFARFWSERDPEAAARWAVGFDGKDSHDEFNPYSSAMREAVIGLKRKDPGAAARWGWGLPDGKTRSSEVYGAVFVWALSCQKEAEAWVLQLPESRCQEAALTGLINGIVEKNPARAAELSMKVKDDDSGVFHKIGWHWGAVDAESAGRWAETLPEGNKRLTALSGVIEGLAEKTPEAAARMALQLPKGEPRNEALGCVASEWVRLDAAAASQWAERLPDEADRLLAVRKVASKWWRQDDVAARRWVGQLPEGELRDWALADIAAGMGNTHFESILEVARQIPVGPARWKALAAVAYSMSMEDAEGAAKLVLELPADCESRPTAIFSAATSLAESNPASAAEMADQLSRAENGPSRIHEIVAAQWAEIDPVSAKNWAAQLPIPGEDKTKLLQKLNMRKIIR